MSSRHETTRAALPPEPAEPTHIPVYVCFNFSFGAVYYGTTYEASWAESFGKCPMAKSKKNFGEFILATADASSFGGPDRKEEGFAEARVYFKRNLPEWLNRIAEIPAWFIKDTCDTVVQKRLVSRADAHAAEKFLIDRGRNLGSILDRHRDKFPGIENWKSYKRLFR